MSRFVLPFLLLALPGVLEAQATTGAVRPSPEIVANGVGTVKLKPDLATITLAVVTRARSAAEAGRLNVERIVPVIAAFKRLGLMDSAIVSTGYSVSSERDVYGGSPTAVGTPPTYVARNSIRVSLTNLNGLGQMIDSALAAGATEVTNIAFSSSQAGEARQRAIATAVQAARSDALAAAEAAGGVLGALIEVSLVPNNGYSFGAGGRAVEYSMAASVIVSTPLMPSDVTVSAQALVRFVFTPRP